ncbi:MAG: hypothetical protein L0206_04955 [Actinobacteria bacterium]|nr:hypothetical protein [Actinomycetota bacterium]
MNTMIVSSANGQSGGGGCCDASTLKLSVFDSLGMKPKQELGASASNASTRVTCTLYSPPLFGVSRYGKSWMQSVNSPFSTVIVRPVVSKVGSGSPGPARRTMQPGSVTRK